MNLLAILTLAAVAVLDFEGVKAEKDPPKRAVKSIEFASQKMTEARDFSAAQEFEKAHASLAEVAEASEFSLEALRAKRNVGAMKKVEQRCRDLLRRLETLKVDLPVDERDAVTPIEKRVQAVQENVLASIMGRKR